MYLLGDYISPHLINLLIAYDYSPSPSQQYTISPSNYAGPWGSDQSWGQLSLWGGPLPLENWKVPLERQTCSAFQITMNEIFDPSYGTMPGAGFTLSSLASYVGLKKGYRPIGNANTAG